MTQSPNRRRFMECMAWAGAGVVWTVTGGVAASASPVVDLADQGFPLVGGRLDYADNRVVAALVYRRRAHIINLFVLPATFGSDWRHARPSSYSVVHWRRGSLDYWAVSDVEAGDLKQFQQDFEARAGS